MREELFEYPYFRDQVTGIAVSRQGRIFVNFPRWDKDPLYSVAELLPNGTLSPYPGYDWNRWGKDEAGHPEAHFICVQSVVVDGDDYLWVLDPASPAFKGVVPGGAKLVKFNLATNTVERNIPFDNAVAPKNSYLNDVRFEPDGDFAFITDSGTGAIVVVDLESGKSWRRLAGHPSTKAEPGYVPVINGKELRDENGQVPKIHADGIAIDAEGEYLYYHALTARTLYRIRISALTDPKLPEEQVAKYVEKVAETGAVDGMLMDADDNLYLTALEQNAILRYRPAGDTMETISQNDRIQWPDSMDISPDDFLYFTASQINRMPRFNYGKDERILPYRLFKVWLAP
jgi:sugar lactone lactonase YvrE